MKLINTEKAPGAIGPYSQGFEVNGIVYTSGQIPVNPADGTVPEGIAAQAEQSCKNVGAILEAAGSGYDKVIKTTCFLADMGDFTAFNEVYAKYFTSKPARSCVAVKSLPKGVLCEIEAIARRSSTWKNASWPRSAGPTLSPGDPGRAPGSSSPCGPAETG